MLRLLQRHAGKPTTVVPDGIFGPETAVPCGNFNSRTACPSPERPTLRLGTPLWMPRARRTSTMARPSRCARLFQPMQTISPGEQNMHLYLAQGMLQALRHYYDGACRPFP